LAQEITVWDWESGDSVAAAYFDQAKAEFEAANPGCKLLVLSGHLSV
jgi:ABC-type glycerol-3-phosphate transport system substrate-binding protein